MTNVFDTLKERGFVEQTTHEEEIKKMLEKEKVTFYIGFDPTRRQPHRRTLFNGYGNEPYAESGT